MYTAYPIQKEDYLSDGALMRRMRALALHCASDSAARLPGSAEARRAIGAVRRAMDATRTEERMGVLVKAADAAALMEPAALSPAAKGPKELPAVRGEARILLIAREILLGSGMQPSAERICMALRAFTQERALRMEELLRIPDALRVQSLHFLAQACLCAVQIQNERGRAAQWLHGRGPLREGAVFLEQAVRLSREEDLPERHAQLERALSAQEGGAQGVVARAHALQTRVGLHLESLPAAMHTAASLDPEQLLSLSDAAQLLLAEPGYLSCDEESRGILRRCIGEISLRARIDEAAVVRGAISLAKEAAPDTLRAQCAWYWTQDEGRALLLRRLGRADVRLMRRTPDPKGYFYMTAVLSLAAALFGALVFGRGPLWLWPFAAIVCCTLSSGAVNALCVRLFPARPLLRLELARVPEELRTLVVIPAILPDAARARELAGQLEVLAAGERDANVEFCLLGDFPDADEQHLPGDEGILRAAKQAVGRANERIGCRRIHFLHRQRQWNGASSRWMGPERKRGALRALNALLLRNENAFDACGEDGAALAGRFRYVITIDADTRPYPHALRMLIGTIAHPVNRLRGLNVLQPQMTLSPAGDPSPFVRLMAGAAGVNGYGGASSEVYQDLCAQGGFAGKGIYDLSAFDRLAGRCLPDNAILSHDLLEGFLAGSAFAGDIVFLDGFPASLASYFKRLHRWTRGDWQLLPFLGGRTALQKYRMLDNLRMSLAPLSALGLMLYGLYASRGAILLAGLLCALRPFLFSPCRESLKRAAAELSLLPNEAFCRTDAALRALHRTFITHKNMLEWVSAADAERQGGKTPLWPRVLCAALCALLSLHGSFFAIGLPIAAAFLLGAPILEAMQAKPAQQRLDPQQSEFLRSLARDTWKFFEQYTGESGFPPDNVQFDPPRGAAKRTSPTNIALYMVSCIAAQRLGFIPDEEMLRRLRATVASLEQMEKWHGMPYNWIDPETTKPLRPRYVSSVDSGNLAAGLLLCAGAVRGTDAPLCAQMERLAGEMDLAALYDPVRRLFVIGCDVQNGRLSHSHYDLLASEARILSFTAILLGKVPLSHWKHLSRACAKAGDGAVPLSWSGTMFEYLMPELFFRTPAQSLLGEGCKNCVLEQKKHRPGGFWGVSESGYYAFDQRRNYQYRAFGLRALMCRDEGDAPVVAPYASALALCTEPAEAADNLMRMHEAGFTTPCGLAEAIDFAPQRMEQGSCAVVQSAMAHHQGMLLAACANALTDGSVRDCFALRPDVQAFSPLLEEAPVSAKAGLRSQQPRRAEHTRMPKPRSASFSREAKPGLSPADAHLICAGGSSLYLRADGSAALHSHGLLVNRRSCDPRGEQGGFFTHIRIDDGEPVSLLQGRARFAPGSALFRQKAGCIEASIVFSLSPEDGALVRRIVLRNSGAEAARVELRDLSPIALCSDAQAQEHIAFADLFLLCSSPARGALRLMRRPRAEGEDVIALDYRVCGLQEDERLELFADRPAMLRRGADPSCAQHVFASALHRHAAGAGLSPLQGACIGLTVPAHGERAIGLTSLVSRCEDESALPEADRYAQMESLLRAQRLCEEQHLSFLRFLDLTPNSLALFERAASLCMDELPHRACEGELSPGIGKEALWPLGISGDRPVIAAYIRRSARSADEFLRLNAYLHAMGVAADALLLYDSAPGYSQPLRDDLLSRMGEMHLPGPEVRLWARGDLPEGLFSALQRLCALFWTEGSAAPLLPGPSVQTPPLPPEPLVPETKAPAPQGRFSNDGTEYVLRLMPGEATAQAWSNLLAGERFGALVTETGGGSFWYGSSRSGRLTAFGSDVIAPLAPLKLWLEEEGRLFRLVPSALDAQADIFIRQGESEFLLQKNGLCVRIVRCTDPDSPLHAVLLCIEAADGREHSLCLRAALHWLMGVHETDLRALQTGFSGDMQFAFGAGEGVGCMRLPGSAEEGGALSLKLRLSAGERTETALLIGAADDAGAAQALLLQADAQAIRMRAAAHWRDLLGRVHIETGDAVRDSLLCRWMPYQTISARLRARTGPSQPGGAYGFRDQLQDVLCMSEIEPAWAREHILLCAAHQFPEGDVQHWWHPPRTGVRTRISDDMLFLPFAAADYIRLTGDERILNEPVPYLAGEPIPDGQRDLYREAGVSTLVEPLREHCMRAVRLCAGRTGAHSLPLMGGGDWNDGMDRIGAQGRGESVWLAQFLCVTAREFAKVCPQYADELNAISQRMLENIERHAWDGDRYLRAFRDDGTPVGSRSTEGGCRIDALSQSWAVFAGCEKERTIQAMETMYEQLFDEEPGILRLLDPPFAGNMAQTGYIAAYPPGIRENGGQYTHAACWAMLAYARLGNRRRAWQLLRAILPAGHCDTPEKAARYRAEPYALAADIYACSAAYAGRAGWTWYTGSAGWLFRAFCEGIAGLERRGSRVRMCALLDEGMDELRVVLRWGASEYTLVSGRAYPDGGWAELIDDGAPHELHFCAR